MRIAHGISIIIIYCRAFTHTIYSYYLRHTPFNLILCTRYKKYKIATIFFPLVWFMTSNVIFFMYLRSSGSQWFGEWWDIWRVPPAFSFPFSHNKACLLTDVRSLSWMKSILIFRWWLGGVGSFGGLCGRKPNQGETGEKAAQEKNQPSMQRHRHRYHNSTEHLRAKHIG